MRGILGVPLVYINRSVMIMEPMAGATSDNRDREERGKFRAGLKRGSGSLKRKREDGDDEELKEEVGTGEDGAEASKPKKKGRKGPKGPNPLAVKKSKKKTITEEGATPRESNDKPAPVEVSTEQGDVESGGKHKRRRKHKSAGNGGGVESVIAQES
jgi:U3 small nucleolar RNA-associated protein 23